MILSTLSTKLTACGFPTDRHVVLNLSPATYISSFIKIFLSVITGIFLGVILILPILIITSLSIKTGIIPAFVSISNFTFFTFLFKYTATHLRPSLHILLSVPSGLYIIILTSALADEVIKIIPLAPIP